MQPARRAEPLFGTDGIRAPAGSHPLDRETVGRLGRRLAERLTRDAGSPVVVLGGDTRSSTPEICRWLAAGLSAGGASTRYAGTMPTPGVGFLTGRLGAAAGIAVSASHNPWPDNGIKLFDAGGGKWSPANEGELEAALLDPADGAPGLPHGQDPEIVVDPALAASYLDALALQATQRGGAAPLDGLSIVLDCAHGAAYRLAPELFRRLGARVATLGDRPDGRNINLDCGSTQPGACAAAVRSRGADLGFAFDGDADRAIAVDRGGEVRDGDALLYVWARALHGAGELVPPKVVATSMSNLGLARALAREGIELVRCDVGDRAVAETMHREGVVLGGEQSGHLIHARLGPTGDGLQTAVHVAATVAAAGRPLAELLAAFRRLPQVLVNVRVARKPDLLGVPAIARIAREVERSLGDRGRLVLRYSGTEPLARVMIEGEDGRAVESLAGDLARVIEKELA